MKIVQPKRPFQPVSIQLETREEADTFWGMVEEILKAHKSATPVTIMLQPPQRRMMLQISNWMSQNLQS